MERGVKALNEVQRDRLIRAWAKEIKTQLDHLLPNKPTEDDLRSCVAPQLDNFCREVATLRRRSAWRLLPEQVSVRAVRSRALALRKETIFARF
jgi:hypothetical protein